ncbi:MAG TPA: aromatic acid exporter family protein [Enteractinococcus sp.]
MPSEPRDHQSSTDEATVDHLEDRPESLTTRIVRRLKEPETTADLLLAIKAVIAATTAWALSVGVLGTDVAFMAPWTALLTVHATVHRSLSRGVQTTVSSAVGMGLAFVVMYFLGVNIWTFALALFVGLMGARLSWIRDEGVAIATTALFIFTSDDPMFADRIVELLLGVVVGIAVNILVIPPLRDRQAARYVDSINRRMGAVLVDMADEFSENWDTDSADAWLQESHSMTDELNSAWQTVKLARESRRENPRRLLRRKLHDADDDVDYLEVLTQIDEGISHLRNMTRTMRDATWSLSSWDDRFREGWVRIARDLGEAIANPDGDVKAQGQRLDQLVTEMSKAEKLPNIEWPVYGAMLSSLRHLVNIFSEVTSDRESRDPGDDSPDH